MTKEESIGFLQDCIYQIQNATEEQRKWMRNIYYKELGENMKKFSVVKFYGHFRQHWDVYANSKEEAWETATRNGVLTFEGFYGDSFEGDGYVVDHDKVEQNTVTKEEYDKWLAEAISLGMIPREEWRKTHG